MPEGFSIKKLFGSLNGFLTLIHAAAFSGCVKILMSSLLFALVAAQLNHHESRISWLDDRLQSN